MAYGGRHLINVDVNYDDALAATKDFNKNVDAEIRSILSRAQSAQNKEASSRQAGRELERLRQEAQRTAGVIAKAFNVDVSQPLRQLKELNKLLNEARGGSFSNVKAGFDTRDFGPDNKPLIGQRDDRSTIASLGLTQGLRGRALIAGSQEERLNAATTSRSAEGKAADARLAAAAVEHDAVQDRIKAIRDGIAVEKAYARHGLELVSLVAQEANLKQERLALEKVAIASALRNNPLYNVATAGAAADDDIRKANQRRIKSQLLDLDDGGLVSDTAQANASEARRKLAIDRSTRALLGEAYAAEKAEDALEGEAAKLAQRLRIATLSLGESQEQLSIDSNITRLKAQVLAAEGRRAAAEARAANDLAVRNGTGVRYSKLSDRRTGVLDSDNTGVDFRSINAGLASMATQTQRTAAAAARAANELAATARAAAIIPGRFQQMYARLQSRGGIPVNAAQAPTLKNFLGTRALSTIGFGLSGGLLYGGISAMGNLIKEANELEVQLGITESVFDGFQGTVNGVNFEQYKASVLDISRTTGVAADEVASITRQLAGAFAIVDEDKDTVTPDFAAGQEIGTTALKLSKITGLPQQEIADSFSASVLAFTEDGESATDTATRLADAVVGLESKFGVSTTEVLNFTASLAPLASEMGFTLEQLAGFGAVVEQALGSDVAAAENIGRIFASLAENVSPLASLLERGGVDSDGLVAALGSGDLPAALREIIGAYDEIEANDGLKKQIGVLIGGDRQARTFFAVLDRGAQVMNALGSENGDFDGEFDKRWDNYQKTVSATFDRMKRAVEEFGLALFDAGLVDALLFLAEAGGLVADVAKLMLEAFGALNTLMGSLPAKLLVAAAAIKAVGAAMAFAGIGKAGGGLGLMAGLASFASPNTPGGLSPTKITGFQPYTGIPVAQLRPGLVDRSARPVGAHYAAPPRPSATTRLATGSSAFGRGLAGAAATAAPVIAAVAVAELLMESKKIAGELDEQRSGLRALVQAELDEGASPDAIRAAIEGRKGDSQGFGADLRNAATSGFGLFGSAKDDYSVAIDELQRFEAITKTKQLEELIERGYEGDIPNENQYDYDVANQGKSQAQQLDAFVQNYKDNPEDNTTVRNVNKILREAGESDAAIAAAIASIAQSDATKQADRVAAIEVLEDATSGEMAASVAELEVLYADSKVDLDKLVAAYRAEASIHRRAYEILKGEGAHEEAIKELQAATELDNKSLAATTADREERYARAEAVIGSLSGDDPQALIAIKQRRFAETEDPEEKLAIALEIRGLQQQILNEEVELLDSADAQISALTQGIKADPTAYTLLVSQVTQIDPVWQNFLISTFGSVEAAGTLIEAAAKLAIEKGMTMAAALASVIQQKLDNLATFYDGLRSVYGPDVDLSGVESLVDPAAADLRKQQEALANANLPDVGGGIVDDPEAKAALERSEAERKRAEAEAAAEKARQEAQAAAMARISVREAQANGDPVALAKLAQERALLARQFAETESERLEAMAQYIEATQQLDDAFADIAAAQRDLAVARANDDPIRAAQAAVADAYTALVRASGAAEKARTMAALIRAQHAEQDAILGLADARSDLVIAQAEATGDTVKAAQESLKKIQRQLARTDLNPTDRLALEADRVSAEAGVRDARLQEERATIDYQLAIGQITKQQAIGALQALLTIPNLTEEQFREINLAVKALRDQLGADFQFNLPTTLGLPTVYEVRRLGQGGGTGSSYQDNRQINVTVNANTNASAEEIATQVVKVVGQPNLTGTVPKRY